MNFAIRINDGNLSVFSQHRQQLTVVGEVKSVWYEGYRYIGCQVF
jgi:hypothetical protein